METIISKNNPKIMYAKKLLDKKYRDNFGEFLVETKKVIAEALRAGLTPLSIFIDESKTDNNFDNTLNNYNLQIYYVNSNVLKEISSTVSSDGYVAIFKKKTDYIKYNCGNFLILDNLQNPDNLGAIFRSALASNFKQIYLINCVDEYNPKTIRASMGNQFLLDIFHINYDDIATLFNNADLFTASMEGENIFKIKNFNKNTGFVIGNEGNGVSIQLKSLINKTVSIPMANDVESLNASISASIIMFHIFSKNMR